MARAEDVKTQMKEDGLRYASKKAGSLFGESGTGSFSAATMSCFLCGGHRAMSTMGSKKILGKSRRVCGGGCSSAS